MATSDSFCLEDALDGDFVKSWKVCLFSPSHEKYPHMTLALRSALWYTGRNNGGKRPERGAAHAGSDKKASDWVVMGSSAAALKQ